eukprot:TRINITY_DN17609_c0_g1_i1.p2 TRINITY_DN17609_c0_g1~~TRINITY_DN17609_c0_g1_i1.p2  ORF type:complete len:59 (+),score=2.12 TRINITY_DN17609_c0_g1_i1:217-393(+)
MILPMISFSSSRSIPEHRQMNVFRTENTLLWAPKSSNLQVSDCAIPRDALNLLDLANN